ncbi:hypothetical protein MRB53_037205 [Persea americana]|nr:hypothetical protein MRB53_037205 [Persea americana]
MNLILAVRLRSTGRNESASMLWTQNTGALTEAEGRDTMLRKDIELRGSDEMQEGSRTSRMSPERTRNASDSGQHCHCTMRTSRLAGNGGILVYARYEQDRSDE